MAKLFFFVCLLFGLAGAEDAWFSAKLPMSGKLYPVTARFYTQKTADSLVFSAEMQYRAIDTSFSMHTTGLYSISKGKPVWQNSIRSGLYSVEWTFRDYRETPAAAYWPGSHGSSSITFESDAIPEEFLYFLTERISSADSNRSIKVLSSVWEVPFVPEAWITDARYTGNKTRIYGVDCFQVLYTRSDGARAEYYITEKGKQVWRFQTFRGVWFDRVQ